MEWTWRKNMVQLSHWHIYIHYCAVGYTEPEPTYEGTIFRQWSGFKTQSILWLTCDRMTSRVPLALCHEGVVKTISFIAQAQFKGFQRNKMVNRDRFNWMKSKGNKIVCVQNSDAGQLMEFIKKIVLWLEISQNSTRFLRKNTHIHTIGIYKECPRC